MRKLLRFVEPSILNILIKKRFWKAVILTKINSKHFPQWKSNFEKPQKTAIRSFCRIFPLKQSEKWSPRPYSDSLWDGASNCVKYYVSFHLKCFRYCCFLLSTQRFFSTVGVCGSEYLEDFNVSSIIFGAVQCTISRGIQIWSWTSFFTLF